MREFVFEFVLVSIEFLSQVFSKVLAMVGWCGFGDECAFDPFDKVEACAEQCDGFPLPHVAIHDLFDALQFTRVHFEAPFEDTTILSLEFFVGVMDDLAREIVFRTVDLSRRLAVRIDQLLLEGMAAWDFYELRMTDGPTRLIHDGCDVDVPGVDVGRFVQQGGSQSYEGLEG